MAISRDGDVVNAAVRNSELAMRLRQELSRVVLTPGEMRALLDERDALIEELRCGEEKYQDGRRELENLRTKLTVTESRVRAEEKRAKALYESLERTCGWCGDLIPDFDAEQKTLTHTKVCTKHPMREVERQLAEAHARIAALEAQESGTWCSFCKERIGNFDLSAEGEGKHLAICPKSPVNELETRLKTASDDLLASAKMLDKAHVEAEELKKELSDLAALRHREAQMVSALRKAEGSGFDQLLKVQTILGLRPEGEHPAWHRCQQCDAERANHRKDAQRGVVLVIGHHLSFQDYLATGKAGDRKAVWVSGEKAQMLGYDRKTTKVVFLPGWRKFVGESRALDWLTEAQERFGEANVTVSA